jgi:hypothetical protein
VQHLSRLPGYPTNGIYTDITGNGVIDLSDELLHSITIDVRDAAGNLSIVNFGVQGMRPAQQQYQAVSSMWSQKEFYPGFVNVFENEQLRFYLAENQVYDSFRFRYNEIVPAKGYPIYQLHNGSVPVHTMFPVSIRNTVTTNPGKMVMHRSWGSKDDYAAAVSEYPWFRSNFRAFGNFQLIEDTIPPVITPVAFREGMNAAKLTRLAFVVKDNTEELLNFRAELDGKWLRFSNDKGRTFIYRFDERCPRGLHELKISVEDLVGNRTEKVYHFTR